MLQTHVTKNNTALDSLSEIKMPISTECCDL